METPWKIVMLVSVFLPSGCICVCGCVLISSFSFSVFSVMSTAQCGLCAHDHLKQFHNRYTAITSHGNDKISRAVLDSSLKPQLSSLQMMMQICSFCQVTSGVSTIDWWITWPELKLQTLRVLQHLPALSFSSVANAWCSNCKSEEDSWQKKRHRLAECFLKVKFHFYHIGFFSFLHSTTLLLQSYIEQ